jgi:fibronectin-binding autotransporter adhesin
MSIRKFRAARVTTTTANIYVGQQGDMFYDETLGQLKISDGHTAGGHLVFGAATSTKLGGIKAGPGAVVGSDGLLTIDTSGLPLNIGDLAITQANISTVNGNEDLNLLSNGTGDINLVGNLHVHTTSQGPDYPVPILSADNYGNVTVNGNLIINGKSYFVGNIVEIGNLTVTGNTVNNGVTTFNGLTIINGDTTRTGNTLQSGNVTITGNSINNGLSTFNGNVIFNGNTIRNGATISTGNVTWNGTTITNGNAVNNGATTFNGNVTTVGNLIVTGNTAMVGNVVQQGNLTITGVTINNGLSVFNGNIAMVGNAVISGNTNITGIATLTGNSYITGNTFVTGMATLTGNSYITGNTFVTGPTTVAGNVTITGNSTQTGQSMFIVSTNNSNQGAVEITGNAQGLSQPPVLPGVMLHVTGQDNGTTPGRSYFDAAGSYSIIVGRKFNGTVANPTQVLAGEEIFRLAGTGYPTGGWPTTGVAQIRFIADENQTQTNRGGHLDFLTVPIGSNVVTQVMSVSSTSGVTIAGNVTAGNVIATTYYGNVIGTSATHSGSVSAGNIAISSSGTLSTPRVVINDGGLRTVNSGTALTIDFSVDSRILWYVPSGDTTITLSNYTAGAQVEVMVRMGAAGRNIALGIAGVNNSTTGTTSLTGHGAGAQYGANQAVSLVYTCYDNTQANCYVRASYV